MNALLIFVVRLILGLVFGIILTRLFRPEWTLFHGVIAGLVFHAGFAEPLFPGATFRR